MLGWFHGIKIVEWNIFLVVLSHDGCAATIYAAAGLQTRRQIHRTARYFFWYRQRSEKSRAPYPGLLAGRRRETSYRCLARGNTGRFLPGRCGTPDCYRRFPDRYVRAAIAAPVLY